MGKPQKITASLTPEAVEKLKAGKDGEKYTGLPDEGKETEFLYDFGDTTEESIAIFGDKVVRSYVVGHCLFTIQGIARSMMKAGKTEKQIQAFFFDEAIGKNVYLPSEYSGRKTAAEKEHDRIQKLSPERQAQEVAALKAMLKKLEKGA